jgi:DNA invertase Pin-like site-specific DNA recombinase
MRAALYGRVSTDSKNKAKRQETENQMLQLRGFAETQGWIVGREYVDRVTGGTADREQFQQMFEAASRREFDVLLFWSLDRLSREGVLETLQHLQRLTGYGIAWRSFTEQYLDSTGIFRDAVIGILAAVAKQEKVRISERTKAGLDRARREGVVLGRPRAAVNPAEVKTLRERGLSWGAISRETGFARGTCQKAIA